MLAGLAELVDALDSDSSVRLGHSGSSPEFRICLAFSHPSISLLSLSRQ